MHLGFIDTDKEQIVNGLRFYPMKKLNIDKNPKRQTLLTTITIQ